MSNDRPTPNTRADYRHFLPIQTRWMDNDQYGHINNVTYYSYFDTVVNDYLIAKGLLDPATSPQIGLVVHTQCHYFASAGFPESLEAGLAVKKLGNSSVVYAIGLFKKDGNTCIAQGEFTHVYVDRTSNKPTPLPDDMRATLESLLA